VVRMWQTGNGEDAEDRNKRSLNRPFGSGSYQPV